VVHGGIRFYCFDRLDKRSCWDKVHQKKTFTCRDHRKNKDSVPLLDRLSTVNEPRDASSYSCWNCTCGRIGSCILVGTAHVARQASAYSLRNCTCGKIWSCKVELHMWEKCDSFSDSTVS
jgi:hypothetical protein